MFRTRSRLVSSTALAIALVMGAAACGGGDEDPAGASDDTPTSAETTTTAAPIIAPLSGVVDPTGASVTRPVLTVKVENTASALPQDGIDQADVVYEDADRADPLGAQHRPGDRVAGRRRVRVLGRCTGVRAKHQ
jgi:hypothetical protein